jgi:NAD(P)-dependent dehydrogenase (short-subunit alcohol dehydrogenase family)
MTLAGKLAVVTGATRGIGRSIAERLATDGAHVIGTGRRLEGTLPDGVEFRVVDFTAASSLESFIAELGQMAPDILVNNAGINKIGPFEQIAAQDFANIQELNVTVPFRLCQVVLPAMKKRAWGRIVNVSSVWGKLGKELRASYSASKFALVGMSSALAAEVARSGILVNCVSPGPIETEMTRRTLSPEMLQDLLQAVPMGRLGQPQEVAALVAWLAGPENTFVTGQDIAVDGGMTRV